MENNPGIKTSEGITVVFTVLAPLVAALAKLEGWPLVAALGVAALVASVYIAARTWLKGKGVAAALVLALVLAPTLARADALPRQALPVPQLHLALADGPAVAADTKAQPSAPTATADEPPAATPAPAAPTALEAAAKVAACTIAGIPDAVGKCIANPGNPAPLDSRSFWMSFGTGMGTSVLVPVVTLLLTHYWPATNDSKQ